MSDDQNAQGQGRHGGGTPPSPERPRYGEYAPGYVPDWQQAAPQQLPGPGWAPPPKPGLIPLRPLPFGTLLGAPFQALRRNPRITVGAALLLQGIPSIIVSVLLASGAALLLTRAANADAADQATLRAGAVGGVVVLGVLSIVISTVFSALLQGVVVAEVARGTVGDKLTFGALWRAIKGRLGVLIGWTFLFALAWIVALGLLVGVIIALAALGGTAGVIGAVLAGLFGGIGLLVLAVRVNTKLAIVPSAIVLERLPLRAAVARSWRLTTGYFWKTFGLIALIGVIVYSVTQVIAIPFGILGAMVGAVFDPTGASTAGTDPTTQLIVSQLGVNLLSSVVTAVVGAIGSVLQTAAVALLYIDLRMRKEGLDLQLVRYVEGRQAGQDLPDPYLAPAPGAAPPAAPAAWPGG
ncbi:hypothetical protein [Leifsonia sp. AG29]|uniref:hypothetical protein n=1 Tax=Leifsonia sp. AG29 TaxID=2598860 RepID=UPI00131BC466|nr:hypothetical protein [Leifsonia sp. AG29]